jgi:thiamine-phosphate pyrophosphorylase
MIATLRGLMVLADDAPNWKIDPIDQARAACEGGASVVQLRAKRATDAVALEWAEAIREITRKFDVGFFVNDRFDLALAADADGVHLGQDDIPPSRIPMAARSRLLVGRSTHSLEQAREACEESVDYIAFGPIFSTGSKDSPCDPRGVERLAEVVRAVQPQPVIAIGGIDLGNVARVAEAGVAGIAVISAIAKAADPRRAARELAEILRERGGA